MLTFVERVDKVNAVMEIENFRGVGGTGSSRESAFNDLLKNAETFDWESPAED